MDNLDFYSLELYGKVIPNEYVESSPHLKLKVGGKGTEITLND